jgi:hypothetical protein
MKRKPQKAISYGPEWTPDGTRERYRWVENASRGLRVLGAVHDLRERIGRMDHEGWHLDPLGDGETVHGVVVQLPGQDGEALFVPAISDPFNDDCYVVDFHDWYKATGDDTDSAVRDCAHAADRMAECYAERERTFQTEEQAKMAIDDARERIHNARADMHELIAEMRNARGMKISAPAICKELRRCMAAHRASVAAAIREIRELSSDPYSWVARAMR